jgi:hypothetical protein
MLAATLPHLATKAEVADLRTDMVAGFADKPGKAYMWGILAVLPDGLRVRLGRARHPEIAVAMPPRRSPFPPKAARSDPAVRRR